MDGKHTMVLNDGIIVNKEIPVVLKRAAAKIRISLNYVNGFTPINNNIPSKRWSTMQPVAHPLQTVV